MNNNYLNCGLKLQTNFWYVKLKHRCKNSFHTFFFLVPICQFRSQLKTGNDIFSKRFKLLSWCVVFMYYVYVIGHSPMGLFRTNETNDDK